MALKLAKPTPYGNDMEYHKIALLRIFDTLGGSVDIDVYYNQQARLDGKKPYERISFVLPADTFSGAELTANNPKQIAYNYLKTLPEFVGAIDV